MFLQVQHRPPATSSEGMAEDAMATLIKPYIQELLQKGKEYPKTIMYMGLHWCGWAHNLAESMFKAVSFAHDCECFPYAVAQYHAPQTQQLFYSI